MPMFLHPFASYPSAGKAQAPQIPTNRRGIVVFTKTKRLLDTLAGFLGAFHPVMENNRLEELIDESIALELNAAELYKVFSEAIPEDNGFWWQLHLEEKSHAALIRAAKDSFLKRGKFPQGLIAGSIEDLKASNTKISGLIAKFGKEKPTRRQACEVAIELENESGESHYMHFMEKDAETAVETVFQQLNRGDKNHEHRIREHLKTFPVEA